MIMSITPGLKIDNLGDITGGDSVLFGDVHLPKSSSGVFGADFVNFFLGEFGASATSDVDGNGNGLNVIGVAARSNSTEMVKLQPNGDGSVLSSVILDMGRNGLPFASGYGVLPVSLAIESALPNPARGRMSAIFFDVVNRRKSPVMTRQELNGLPFDDPVFAIIPCRKWNRLAATTTAKARRIRLIQWGDIFSVVLAIAATATSCVPPFDRATAINARSVILWLRHSLTSFSGLGIRRTGDALTSPGISLSILS